MTQHVQVSAFKIHPIHFYSWVSVEMTLSGFHPPTDTYDTRLDDCDARVSSSVDEHQFQNVHMKKQEVSYLRWFYFHRPCVYLLLRRH